MPAGVSGAMHQTMMGPQAMQMGPMMAQQAYMGQPMMGAGMVPFSPGAQSPNGMMFRGMPGTQPAFAMMPGMQVRAVRYVKTIGKMELMSLVWVPCATLKHVTHGLFMSGLCLAVLRFIKGTLPPAVWCSTYITLRV